MRKVYDLNCLVSESFLEQARMNPNNIFPINIIDDDVKINSNITITERKIELERNLSLGIPNFDYYFNMVDVYKNFFPLFSAYNYDINYPHPFNCIDDVTLKENIFDEKYSIINIKYYYEAENYYTNIKLIIGEIKSGFKNINEVINYGIDCNLGKIFILSRSLIFKALVSDEEIIDNSTLTYGNMFLHYNKLDFSDIEKYYNLEDINMNNLNKLLDLKLFTVDPYNSNIIEISNIYNGLDVIQIFYHILSFYNKETIDKNIDKVSSCICNIINNTFKLKEDFSPFGLEFNLMDNKCLSLFLRKNVFNCIGNVYNMYFENQEIREYILRNMVYIMEHKDFKIEEGFNDLYLVILDKLFDFKYKAFNRIELYIEDYISLGIKVGIDKNKILKTLGKKKFDKRYDTTHECYRLMYGINDDSFLHFTLQFKKDYFVKSELINNLMYTKLVYLDRKYLNEENLALEDLLSYFIKKIGSMMNDDKCNFFHKPIEMTEEEINILSKYIDLAVIVNVKNNVSNNRLLEIATREFEKNSIFWLIKQGCNHLRDLETEDKEKLKAKNKLEKNILNMQI